MVYRACSFGSYFTLDASPYSRKLPSEIHLGHLVKVMQSYLLSEHVMGLQCLTNIASPAGSLDSHSENTQPLGP